MTVCEKPASGLRRNSLSAPVANWLQSRRQKTQFRKIFRPASKTIGLNVGLQKWRSVFQERRVVVVGNAPNLIGCGLGKKIDGFDVVLRVNLTDPTTNAADLGTRTDSRFIGATMLERHIPALNGVDHNNLIISTEKNLTLLGEIGFRPLLFNRNFPRTALPLLSQIHGDLDIPENLQKPPRSGIVLLAILIACSRAKTVAVAGFSTKSDDAMKSIHFSDNSVRAYDQEVYKTNHCDLMVEVGVLLKLSQIDLIELL